MDKAIKERLEKATAFLQIAMDVCTVTARNENDLREEVKTGLKRQAEIIDGVIAYLDSITAV